MRHALAVDEASPQGVARRFRLLKNLLEHKMRIVVKLCRIGFPFDALGIAFDLLVGQGVNGKSLARDLHHVVVFQVDHFVRQL